MKEQFLRTEMVLGPDAMERLAAAHVAVFGLGGVGSWAAEALARAGVGTLTLIDHDEVGVTNLNRQIQALWSTQGQPKAEAMAARVHDINPDCNVYPVVSKYEPANREDFFSVRYDYIVDAIDMVSSKLDLIQTAIERGIPILSALGTGNKLDPSQFRITDISKTPGPGDPEGAAQPGHSAPPGTLLSRAAPRHRPAGDPAARTAERSGQRALGAAGGRTDDGGRRGAHPGRSESRRQINYE